MIALIPVGLFLIILVYGLCRSFYEYGLGNAVVREDVNIVMLKEGFKYKFIPDPIHKEKSEEIINNLFNQIERYEVKSSYLNPLFFS